MLRTREMLRIEDTEQSNNHLSLRRIGMITELGASATTSLIERSGRPFTSVPLKPTYPGASNVCKRAVAQNTQTILMPV